jgi:hypothetical protein
MLFSLLVVYRTQSACGIQDTFIGLARTVYIYTVFNRIFGDFPARNTVYALYIYGSGQPYTFMFPRLHTHKHTNIHAHVHTQTHTETHTRTHTHAHTHRHTQHTHTHTAHTHTHSTHTHTHTQHKATSLVVQCKSCKGLLPVACKPGMGGAIIPRYCSLNTNPVPGSEKCEEEPYQVGVWGENFAFAFNPDDLTK